MKKTMEDRIHEAAKVFAEGNTLTVPSAWKPLKAGNMKLAKSVLIWSIPAGLTCPNAADCVATCYAMKAQRMYPSVRFGRMRRLALAILEQEWLEDRIVEQILTAKTAKAVRIHESGDFWSLDYVEFWCRIARRVLKERAVQFYTYTKMTGFAAQLREAGINVVESVLPDGSINYGPASEITNRARRLGVPVCPVTLGVDAKCGESCRLCWTRRYVAFVQH